jgi:DNA (cytosine-5)-methyltransferase 1
MDQGRRVACAAPIPGAGAAGYAAAEALMRYGSVCSGIEAATVAWHGLGWEAAWYSEIEPFPSAVLAHHYPAVPNYGDMTKFEEWPDEPINLLVGGTPCQSFSVAGLRKGLADPRGNLMLTYGAIARRYRPEWLVWENVPGVLSSNGGRDFGTFLGMLAELGYGFAYRVLDAQYFGVAQRRRRVFVVGHLGSWQRAAAVLFERHSLCGHPAPSREAGEVTPTLTKEGTGVSRTGFNEDGWYVAKTLTASKGQRNDPETDTLMTMSTLNATDAEKWGSNQWVDEGKAIIVPPVAETLIATDYKGPGHNRDHNFIVEPPIGFSGQMSNPQTDVDLMQTVQAKNPMAVAFGIPGNWIGRKPENGGNAVEPMLDVAPCQTKTDVHAVAFEPGKMQRLGYGISDDGSAPTLRADAGDNQLAVAFGGDVARSLTARYDSSPCADRGMDVVAVAPALTASNNPSRSPQSSEVTQQVAAVHQTSMQVRRLTPVECERLQGFPDNYTNIPWRKKDEAPDGPRYKALGNSMAVPVMRWIGERIQKVEDA